MVVMQLKLKLHASSDIQPSPIPVLGEALQDLCHQPHPPINCWPRWGSHSHMNTAKIVIRQLQLRETIADGVGTNGPALVMVMFWYLCALGYYGKMLPS